MDQALEGFLFCVQQLCAVVARRDPAFVFPYQMLRDRIGVLPNNMISVKYSSTDEALWSRALKYMLTNMKYLIAFLAKKNLEQHDLHRRNQQ